MGKVILTQGLSALLQLSCCNWTSHIREGWECCGCSLSLKKAQCHLVSVHKWLKGECKEVGAWLFSVVNTEQRQWARTETQAVSSEHQETFLHCEGNWAFVRVSQRGYSIFVREGTQKPSRYGPEQLVQGCPWHCLISEAGQNYLWGPFLSQIFCASMSLTGKRKSLGGVKEDTKDCSAKIDSPRG